MARPSTRQNKAPEKKEANAQDVLMKGEKRRANARAHGDIWQEHRKPVSKKEGQGAGGRKKKTAEKKAAEETGEHDAFKVLNAEAKEKTNKRKTKDPVEAKPAPKKRPRREEKQAETADKAEETPKKGDDSSPAKDSKAASGGSPESVEGVVHINRAPTLTLWVAAVAEREGYTPEEGLTFGKYVSGVFAHSKGKSIGVIESDPAKDGEAKERKGKQRAGQEQVSVFGMDVWVKKAEDGQVRALETSGKPIEPKAVKAYLHRAFKDKLEDAQKAMAALAGAYSRDDVGKAAYPLYERFRPSVPHGARGWGSRGELDLHLLSHTLVQEASGGG